MKLWIATSITLAALSGISLSQPKVAATDLEQNTLQFTTMGCGKISPQLYVNTVGKRTPYQVQSHGNSTVYLYNKFHIRTQHYGLHQILWQDKNTGKTIIQFQYTKNEVGNNQYYGFKTITNILTSSQNSSSIIIVNYLGLNIQIRCNSK